MTAKTTKPAPSSDTPESGGGCCGGKAHAAPEQDRRDTASDARHDAKAGGCCCGS